MGTGKKMAGGSFMSKHAKNLLNYMPIDDRAGSGSDSDLNYNGSPLNDNGDHKHPHSTFESIKAYGRKTVQNVKDFVKAGNKKGWTLKSSGPAGGRSLVAPSSEGGQVGFSGDSKPSWKKNN
jgi:hypothetical protein